MNSKGLTSLSASLTAATKSDRRTKIVDRKETTAQLTEQRHYAVVTHVSSVTTVTKTNTTLLLPPTNEEVNAFAHVCLSVCLLARLLKNACMGLNEMLRVDKCRDIMDMEELINF